MGKVLLKNPGAAWQEIEVGDRLSLGQMQKWVQGPIEFLNNIVKQPRRNKSPLVGYSFYGNENSKIGDGVRGRTEPLPYNISVWSHIDWVELHGPVFFCAADESTGEDAPMTDEQVAYIKKLKIWMDTHTDEDIVAYAMRFVQS